MKRDALSLSLSLSHSHRRNRDSNELVAMHLNGGSPTQPVIYSNNASDCHGTLTPLTRKLLIPRHAIEPPEEEVIRLSILSRANQGTSFVDFQIKASKERTNERKSDFFLSIVLDIANEQRLLFHQREKKKENARFSSTTIQRLLTETANRCKVHSLHG